MSNILYDGKREIPREEAIEKMKYFLDKAELGMSYHEKDRRTSLEIAREIRRELEAEYKNNSLKRIRELYRNDNFFNAYYQPSVHSAIASITGQLTKNNVFGFLYDVQDYMRYGLPRDEK